MEISASLREIIGALELQNPECTAYFNKRTGQVLLISNEELAIAEQGYDRADYPEWQQESICTAEDVLENPADYLTLPDRFEINEYGMMEDFCYALEDQTLANKLLQQIKGQGAFRRFKDAIHLLEIEEQWYRFRDQHIEKIAIAWLQRHNITFQRL